MANTTMLVRPEEKITALFRTLGGDHQYGPIKKFLEDQRIELALKTTRFNTTEHEVRMRQMQGAVQLLGDLISLLDEQH